MKRFGNKPALIIWLITMAIAIVVISQTKFISDLSAFMPKSPSPRQQMLVEQLKDGAIARLVILGIEGGDADARANLSRELKQKLSGSPLFTSVQNGDPATQERDQRYFYQNRYLLSPSVDANRFSSQGMHNAIAGTVESLSGDAGLLIKQLLPHDPTGEILSILDQFTGESAPRTDKDVWVSRDGTRAILMVQLSQSGLNTDAQAAALDFIKQSFNSLPGYKQTTHLLMSGTSVLSVESRHTIQSDVERLATIGTVLVVCLLLLVYRSISLLVLGLLPVVSGALVGIASVSLGFGHVHGLTLGFGTTLIGEAVDYSIYLFIQQTGHQHPSRFWRTIRLGVLTSITGFAALMCSSFPGLSQLGLYSISGLVTAALVTRYIVPGLMPSRVVLRDMTGIGEVLQRILTVLGRLRWLLIASGLAAMVVLVINHQSLWNRQLNSLSPVSKAQSALDSQLRGDLGSNDMRYVASLVAPTQEQALQQAENVEQVLRKLMSSRVIGGYHTPNQLLPSLATQRQRQAAIPDTQQIHDNLSAALANLPLKADKLTGFIEDLQKARSSTLLTRASLQGTSSGVLLDSMLVKRDHDYLVLIPLRATGIGAKGDEINLDRVRQAFKNQPDVTVIDLLEETTDIFDNYAHEVILLSSLGCVAVIVLLCASCGIKQGIRVAIPLACSVLCVVALLHALGIQLTILHLVGLLLVVAIGSNYALFFTDDASAMTVAEQHKVNTSLLVANLATVASFGLLGTSSVPVLSYIGSTVGMGAFLALLFSAMLAQVRADARHS